MKTSTTTVSLLALLVFPLVCSFAPTTTIIRVLSPPLQGISTTRTSSRRFSKEEDDTWVDDDDDDETLDDSTTSRRDFLTNASRRDFLINAVALGLIGASGIASWSLFQTNVYTPDGFQRLPRTQFLAALGDPQAQSGTGAKDWGLWRLDPGPRGVWLDQYSTQLVAAATPNNNDNNDNKQQQQQAPAGWTFDPNDWWLEEHGLIMEAPQFPLSAGRYLVTGGRLVTTGLTIDSSGSWKLDEGTLYDVTHLPCRSARYTPDDSATSSSSSSSTMNGGSPLTANPKDFPVAPGAIMPAVPGCTKQDYAVLFVVGTAAAASPNKA
jgi:hypothetical protein